MFKFNNKNKRATATEAILVCFCFTFNAPSKTFNTLITLSINHTLYVNICSNSTIKKLEQHLLNPANFT